MSHTLTKIWIHTIFGTKEREPLIAPGHEKLLYDHISSHLETDFGCHVRSIDGTANHIHILFRLDPKYAVKDILQNIKGESSHWMNQQDFLKIKFSWQTGYGAYSISDSNVPEVERYIRNQKEHHKRKSFDEEYRELLETNGLQFLMETVKTVIF
jgi:putative transposase